jgi:hypothetical protein
LATFTESSLEIEITFDRETNKAGLSGPEPCNAVLSEATASKLGTGSYCVWTSDTTLLAVLGAGATINIGDVVGVNSTAIRAKGETSSFYTGFALLTAPTSNLQPIVNIIGPSQIPTCVTSFSLDTSQSVGLGGRAPTIAWTLQVNGQPNKQQASIINFLATQTSAVLNFDATMLTTNTEYVFQVTITNYLGQSGIGIHPITRTNIVGPSVMIKSPSTIRIQNYIITILLEILATMSLQYQM